MNDQLPLNGMLSFSVGYFLISVPRENDDTMLWSSKLFFYNINVFKITVVLLFFFFFREVTLTTNDTTDKFFKD